MNQWKLSERTHLNHFSGKSGLAGCPDHSLSPLVPNQSLDPGTVVVVKVSDRQQSLSYRSQTDKVRRHRRR